MDTRIVLPNARSRPILGWAFGCTSTRRVQRFALEGQGPFSGDRDLMASHPSDQQSPRSEGNVRRSLRESMNMSNGPASRPPLEESEESASMLAALQDKPEEAAQDDPEEITRLQEEGDHLRYTLRELHQQLEQVGGDAQPGWGEREREYE